MSAAPRVTDSDLYSVAIAADGTRVDLEAIIRESKLDFAFAFSLIGPTRTRVRVASSPACSHLLDGITSEIFGKSTLDFEVRK